MTTVFSPDYVSARDRFREAAMNRNADLSQFPIAGAGPAGESLTIDVAQIGSRQAPRRLVISSGLHGVEGLLGSAVQLDFMTGALCDELGDDMSVLLIHALNPYGMAWRRRFDEQNIDPNRNFLLAGQEFSGSPPGYAALDRLLNPPRAPRRGELFQWKAAWQVARHGMTKLKQAVAGGQYDFPRGLFFGGHGPCQTQRVLDEYLTSWIGAADHVLHLDFHTGLGRWATYKLLLEYRPERVEQDWLAKAFGAEALEYAESAGVAYETRGGLGNWCRAKCSECHYSILCAEFGTYPPLPIIRGLRRENQTFHYCAPDAAETASAKAALQQLFCPDAIEWRQSVLEQSRKLCAAALTALHDPLVNG